MDRLATDFIGRQRTCERFWKMVPPCSRMRFHLPLPSSRTCRIRKAVSSSFHLPFRLLHRSGKYHRSCSQAFTGHLMQVNSDTCVSHILGDGVLYSLVPLRKPFQDWIQASIIGAWQVVMLCPLQFGLLRLPGGLPRFATLSL